MKIKVFVVAMALMLCSVITAQGNCYPHDRAYVTGNMNIRQSYSTGSQVVGRATAGDTFEVTESKQGDIWCWLRVNAGWLADTARVQSTQASHTVVQPAQPSQPQQGAVDNCCFVDRQCNSEQEWTNGYWAFQNNQCTTSSQSPIPPAPSLPVPRIEGPPRFVAQIEAALNLLKERAPSWYSFVISRANSIVPSSWLSWAVYRERKIKIEERHAFPPRNYQTQLLFLAGVLVHEACHIHRYEGGLYTWDSNVEEFACIGKQIEVIQQIHPGHSLVQWHKDFRERYRR